MVGRMPIRGSAVRKRFAGAVLFIRVPYGRAKRRDMRATSGARSGPADGLAEERTRSGFGPELPEIPVIVGEGRHGVAASDPALEAAEPVIANGFEGAEARLEVGEAGARQAPLAVGQMDVVDVLGPRLANGARHVIFFDV